MIEEPRPAFDDLRELEKATGIILADLHLLSRLCNLVLGLPARDFREGEHITVYFQLRRIVHRLQKEALRQALLLGSVKEGLRDERTKRQAATQEGPLAGPARISPNLSVPANWV